MASCVQLKIEACSGNPVRTPVDEDVLSPWVELIIGERDEVIKVGNKSSPTAEPLHSAVVKSFQIAWAGGAGATIEVVDEAGGSFVKFFNKMVHDVKDFKEYIVKASWGFKGRRCTGYISDTESATLTSRTHHLSIQGIDVDFQQGRVAFTINASHLSVYTFETRNEEIYGSEKNPLTLKTAIRRMFTSIDPNLQIDFKRRTKEGALQDYEFKAKIGGPGEDSLKAKWEGNGNDPIGIAMRWMSNFVTDDNKGIIPIYQTLAENDNTYKPRIIFMEDNTFNTSGELKNQSLCQTNQSVGTFIVHGGHNRNRAHISPVIEFKPTITWSFHSTHLSGGQVDIRGNNAVKSNETGFQEELGLQASTDVVKLGLQMNPAQSPAAMLLGNTPLDTAKNYQIQQKSNSTLTNVATNPIEATLRIQGRPDLDNWANVQGGIVSLIVINPFHISPNTLDDVNECPTWLASPVCNNVLSNTNWRVIGLSHEIREGSYTTTLKIMLDAPGQGININSNLGGDPTSSKWGSF